MSDIDTYIYINVKTMPWTIFFCFGCVWGRAQSQPTYPTCGKANIPQLPSEAKIMLLPESLSVRPWKISHHPKRKGSSSNHHVSSLFRVNLLLNYFGGVRPKDLTPLHLFKSSDHVSLVHWCWLCFPKKLMSDKNTLLFAVNHIGDYTIILPMQLYRD